jgi:hypothetical protein
MSAMIEQAMKLATGVVKEMSMSMQRARTAENWPG